MIKRVVGLYFSPSGETAKITRRITSEIAERVGEFCPDEIESEFFDMLKDPIDADLSFDSNTIAVIGMPSYNGRIPLPCVRLMQKLHGSDTLTVTVVAYGNSSYGNSLYELYNCAEAQGFSVVSAGVFIAQHVLFDKIAQARPDASDMKKILEFCEVTANKMKRFCGTDIADMRGRPAPLKIKGTMPGRDPTRILIHPTADDSCIRCGRCAEICPVGAIDTIDPTVVDPKKCISCAACVYECEHGARGFRGPVSKASELALEIIYNKRKDPEWFI